MAYLQDFLKTNSSNQEQGRHTVYWMPADVFDKLPVKRWQHNRPEDPARVAEIREWIAQSKRVDGVIYLACVENEMVCYESNHRRLAMKGVEGVHSLFVDVLWNATNEEVCQEFRRLNKAISVPDLYVIDEPVVGIHELRTTVDQFCENYKKLCMPSKRPQRPSFNRDTLTDEFYRVLQEKRWTIDQLMARLLELNREMSVRPRDKLSDKVIQKCEETGLWLFAWSNKLEL